MGWFTWKRWNWARIKSPKFKTFQHCTIYCSFLLKTIWSILSKTSLNFEVWWSSTLETTKSQTQNKLKTSVVWTNSSFSIFQVIPSQKNKVIDFMFFISLKNSKYSMVFQFKALNTFKPDNILQEDSLNKSSNKIFVDIPPKMLFNFNLKAVNLKILMTCLTIKNSPNLLNWILVVTNFRRLRCLVIFPI